MLCISVAPVSRKLAKVDLLNAAREGDLVELCLDHLVKEPNVADMLQGISKPILVTCRRSADGGKFDGTEDDRMTLLRQAIVAGPHAVELDLETAAKIPRFGKTQRVISVTTLDGPPDDLDAVFEQSAKVHADVVKFAWPVPTFEAAWPMLKLLAQKKQTPVVGVGIGRAAVTIALLARQFEAPWAYAALEKGLETIPGQPTVSELKDVYSWDDVGPKTRFVGLLGPVDRQTALVARVLNAAFRALGERFRCLPLPIHGFDRLKSRLEGLKINAVLVAPDLSVGAAEIADKREGSAGTIGAVDLLLRQADGWTGYNRVWRHALSAVEDRLGRRDEQDRPLERRNVLVIGTGGFAAALIHGVQRRGGLVSVTGPNDKAAQQLAQKFEIRHVSFANLYDTLSEVVLLADPSLQKGPQKTALNPAYFRSTMTVMEISAMPFETELLAEARTRGCKVVEPADVFRHYLGGQFEAITGKKPPAEAFEHLPSE